MGLDIHLYDGSQIINEKSEKHPDHYCSKSYLRSSYNSSGFNSVVGNMLGKEMHYIFDPLDREETEDGDCISPIYPKAHLEEALLRAKEVRAEMEQMLPFKTETFSVVNLFDQSTLQPIRMVSPVDAYAAFKEKWTHGTSPLKEHAFDYFNQEALAVYACIQGIGEQGEPALHVVSKLWDNYYVQSFSSSLVSQTGEKPPKTIRKEGVLSIFADHEKDNRGKSYSSYDGSFYLKSPLHVHGIIAGCDLFGKPALHVIYRVSEDYLTYYKQQADIIIEFIEKALTLENPRIVWSA